MNEALAGFNVVATTSSDTAKLYVVPENTTPDSATIISAAIGNKLSTGVGVNTTISISANPSMVPGTKFAVYAIEDNGKISLISDTAFTVDYTNTDSIAIGGSVNANIPIAKAKHVFSVNLTAGQPYTFTTSNSNAAGGIDDPTLKLYQHDGEKFILLSSDDDIDYDNGNLEAKISLTASETASYYIMVQGYGSKTGNTTISLTSP